MRVLAVAALALVVGCGGRPLGGESLDGTPRSGDSGLAPDAGVAPADAGVAPADGPAGWTCETDAAGNTTCTQERPDRAGPSGWLCWDYGDESECATTEQLAAGAAWSCETVAGRTRCRRARALPPMAPPNGAWYCWFALEDGRRCSDTPSYGHGPTEPPWPCVPGQRQWCDNATYSGWGQRTCQPNGTWGGCSFNRDPAFRPRTLCGCYYPYLNPDCCELPDCIIPPETDGQTCAAASGALCDYCESSTDCQAGARCIYTNTGESFCGQDCSEAPCPDQHECRTVTDQGGQQYQQCVPTSLTCYGRL